MRCLIYGFAIFLVAACLAAYLGHAWVLLLAVPFLMVESKKEKDDEDDTPDMAKDCQGDDL